MVISCFVIFFVKPATDNWREVREMRKNMRDATPMYGLFCVVSAASETDFSCFASRFISQ